MKINETGRIGAINSYQRNVEARENFTGKKNRQKDQVSISPEAKEMLEAQNQVQDPQRAERINDLKQSVATGTYYVDAAKIAEKLLPYFKINDNSGENK
ncbi:flagellar biosynthesis anti-sigma factor FlgM [Paenibacillus sediminis]|uniref:Negative regulator of flagellin synthesis n=1 Tax=Paenibacillus sediminis TaxID=664909 RepID=A0ABS4H2C1_9BACL|nr:flagellar biosynthesis anti-sigma factor FlgM [Paenibacillus sediminis]MBP1936665.1 negative regulator of flagellin synthesis FlgM [Paenibacillus sediminis]